MEIEERVSMILEKSKYKILKVCDRKVVIEYGDVIFKFYTDKYTYSIERDNMEMVDHPLKPKVLEYQEHDGIFMLKMEKVIGENLGRANMHLNSTQRADLVKQIKELRISLKDKYPSRTKCSDYYLFLVTDEIFDPIRDFLPEITADTKMVFCHGDVHPSNIIMRDGSVVAVVDWEFAGFYPETHEFSRSIITDIAGLEYFNQVFYDGSEFKDTCILNMAICYFNRSDYARTKSLVNILKEKYSPE